MTLSDPVLKRPYDELYDILYGKTPSKVPPSSKFETKFTNSPSQSDPESYRKKDKNSKIPLYSEEVLTRVRKVADALEKRNKRDVIQFRLYNSLFELLDGMIITDNSVANKWLVKELLFCCRYLDLDYIEKLSAILYRLADAGSFERKHIRRLLRRRKIRPFLKRRWLLSVIIFYLAMVIIGIFF
jgi:hypothetical protein